MCQSRRCIFGNRFSLALQISILITPILIETFWSFATDVRCSARSTTNKSRRKFAIKLYVPTKKKNGIGLQIKKNTYISMFFKILRIWRWWHLKATITREYRQSRTKTETAMQFLRLWLRFWHRLFMRPANYSVVERRELRCNLKFGHMCYLFGHVICNPAGQFLQTLQ